MGEGSVSWVMKHCLVAPKSLQTLPFPQRLKSIHIIIVLQSIILKPQKIKVIIRGLRIRRHKCQTSNFGLKKKKSTILFVRKRNTHNS